MGKASITGLAKEILPAKDNFFILQFESLSFDFLNYVLIIPRLRTSPYQMDSKVHSKTSSKKLFTKFQLMISYALAKSTFIEKKVFLTSELVHIM